MRLLEIKNLKFGYEENLILNDINLNLDEGDFVAISGENGSGKSTLIKLILKAIKKRLWRYKNFRRKYRGL